MAYKIVCVLSLVSVTTGAEVRSHHPLREKFDGFRQKYGRTYAEGSKEYLGFFKHVSSLYVPPFAIDVLNISEVPRKVVAALAATLAVQALPSHSKCT